MNEITITTANGGSMRIDMYQAFINWGINVFKRFLKIAAADTAAVAAVVAVLYGWCTDFYTNAAADMRTPAALEILKSDDYKEIKAFYRKQKRVYTSFLAPDEIEKARKFLQVASPEKSADLKAFIIEITDPNTNEEDEIMKNVWYLNENETAAEIETTPAPLPWYLRDDDPEAHTPALTFAEYCEAYPETEEPAELEAPAPAPAEPAQPEPTAEPDPQEITPTAEPAQDAQTTQPTKPEGIIKYKADDLHSILHTDGAHVRYTGHTMQRFDGDGYYITYGARFVVGAMYRVPDDLKKSRSADIVFRVDRNTGKTISITVWEKYNGKITETTQKNKKLNPGNKYEWLHIDKTGKTVNFYGIPENEKDNYIDFTYWECIDIDKISRWTSGTLSVIDAQPVTADDFARFSIVQAQAQPAAPAAQPAQPSAPLDFTPTYYPVSENLARLCKHAMSYDDYKTGSVTAEYKETVDDVYKMCENSTDPEKSLFLADIFAKRLARWFDDWNRNGASCPSVLIAGPANFPVRRKERQNARADVLMKQYSKIMHLRDKIKNPHGYRTEIEREEITDEFDSIIYFDVNINKDENRLQLIFPEKPEENVRAVLKSHGFRWSNRFGAWQRQLTENAVSAVWTVVRKLDDIENAAAESAAAEITEQQNTAA